MNIAGETIGNHTVDARRRRTIRETWNTLELRPGVDDGVRGSHWGRHWALFLAVSLLFVPSPAGAHLVTTGMGPVYDGIGHFLLTPEDFVAVLALALYAGLRGADSGRRVLFLLPLAWFLGGLAGMMVNGFLPFPAPAVTFLVLGLLVATDTQMPSGAVSTLAIVIGLLHGFFNGSALQERIGAPGLIGIMIMLFVLVALVLFFVVSLKRSWARIAVRVAGSWIFASGLLMIGWMVKAQR